MASQVDLFDNGPMFTGQLIVVAANLLGYAITLVAPHMHLHVDLLGTGAFAAGALPGLFLGSGQEASILQRVQWSSVAVITWSVKLACYLFYRITQTGQDKRLSQILENPVWAAGFWTYSTAWGLICSLPHHLGMSSTLPGSPVFLYAGASLYAAGLVTETLADYQKWTFRQRKNANSLTPFCSTGLWSISQHPNWWGNLMVWSGIFLMNAPALLEPVQLSADASVIAVIGAYLWSCRRLVLAALGPMFMWNLFYSQAVGKLLGDSFHANRKKYGYGENKSYTDYVDNTALIIPNPLRLLVAQRTKS